jgi:hypothetical protein
VQTSRFRLTILGFVMQTHLHVMRMCCSTLHAMRTCSHVVCPLKARHSGEPQSGVAGGVEESGARCGVSGDVLLGWAPTSGSLQPGSGLKRTGELCMGCHAIE